MTRALRLAPDLCVDARNSTAAQVVEEIAKLRPKGYVGWEGADGQLRLL